MTHARVLCVLCGIQKQYRKVRKGCGKDAKKRLARNLILGRTAIMDAVRAPVRFRSDFRCTSTIS